MRNETNLPQHVFDGNGESSIPTMSVHPQTIDPHKRRRDDEDITRLRQVTPTHFPIVTAHTISVPSSTASKKSRTSNYQAPRVLKPSILTSTGSLVGGGGERNSHIKVTLRRQLSIGDIEAYMGGHDKMEMDSTNDTRPRSMSF